MAYVQKKLLPPIKNISFTLSNFTGGLANDKSDELLDINQASDILNMAFNEEGSMSKRKGTKKYDNFDYKDEIIFVDNFKSRNGDKLVVATKTELYINKIKIDNLTGSFSGITYLDSYLYVDGHNIKVYGKFPQANDGDHIKIAGTPINDYVLMKVINPTSGYTPLTGDNTIGVWKYNYTSKEIVYEPCKQELDDTYKGNNLLPVQPSIIEMHGDRVFMNGDDINYGNVFISDIQNIYYYPVSMPIQLPPNGEKIKDIDVFMDTIIVGRESDVHVIYGNTNRQGLPNPFLRKRITTHTGMMNNNISDRVHSFLFYLGTDGIVYRMITPRTDVEQITTGEVSKNINLFYYPIEMTLDKLKNTSSIFFNNDWYLFHEDKTLVYSYRFQAWSIFKGIPATCAKEIDGQLVVGTKSGYLYTYSDDYKDDNMPIQSYWASKRYDFEAPSNYKQFKELYVVAHVFPQYLSDVFIRYEIDYVDVEQIASIANKISYWGKALWGDRFITRNISPSLPITIGRRGRKLRIVIMNGKAVSNEFNTFSDMQNQSHPVSEEVYYVKDTKKFYEYILGNYVEMKDEKLYQPLKLYEINGEYKMKGKR